MTDVTSDTEAGKAAVSGAGAADDGLVAELVARAQTGGVKLTGEGGLLKLLTKRVLELLTARSTELTSSCSRSWKRWCASRRVLACAALAPAVSACSWAASALAPAVRSGGPSAAAANTGQVSCTGAAGPSTGCTSTGLLREPATVDYASPLVSPRAGDADSLGS